MSDPAALLLDIEGTTTSISFVYDALFPYARARLAAFLDAHFDDPAVRADVARLGDGSATTAAVDADVKDTGLKGLQGKVWAAGYASGALRGHVFADVPGALRAFVARGTAIYIYSSGSVAAQKLLFGSSEAGDLTPLLSGYFDTTTGPKIQADSYRAIAATIGVAAGDVLFVTDSLREAHAAAAAGLRVAVSQRPGNPPLPDHDFHQIAALTDVI